ncbi:MAG TPA: hypothetical protein VE178_14945 [Silvibacterium sp.]|nr:hypothetical protein [Silvibacterium sp.]
MHLWLFSHLADIEIHPMERIERQMRTTLSIDDDVLAAVKEIASHQGKTVGKVLSELVRKALVQEPQPHSYRSVVPLLPVRPDAKPVMTETVNRLREQLDV